MSILLCALLIRAMPAWAQEVDTANRSVYVGSGRWDWTVFVNAPPEVLRRIKCVQYELHRTFVDPVQKVCELGDPKSPFGITRNGWGTFMIPVTIFFRDGRAVKLKHQLSFAAASKAVSEPVTRDITLDNDATEIQRGLWEWTAFVDASRSDLAAITCVQYHLHPTFPNPVREVCKRGSDFQAFPLTARGWGEFELTAEVFFSDGTSLELSRVLRFPHAPSAPTK